MNKRKSSSINLLWYSHPRIAILLSLIVINIIVIFLFTGILAILSRNNYWAELAYIFTYTMCSDGIYDFINSAEDVACFIVKIVLTIIQMAIFSGALIGFTTDIIQTIIDKRLNNSGKLSLSGHYVFLNWSSIGPQIIYDLSFMEGDKNIVILSEKDREEVLYSIQNIFVENNKKIKNVRIFVKQGDPNSLKSINDVSLSKAKYIGVLLTEKKEDNLDNEYDLAVLKTLLNIINITSEANIVIEAEKLETVNKIESLLNSINPELNKRIIAFSHNNVLGHILGKTVVNSLYTSLIHHLLSYEGSEFYGIEPMDIDEALYKFNNCIPIINYDDDDEIDESGNTNFEHLYILSTTRENIGERNHKKIINRRINFKELKHNEDFTLFVLSNSLKLSLVVDEIEKYNYEYHTNIRLVTCTYNEDISLIIKKIKETEGVKKILLLSPSDGINETHDTEIFLSALEFKIDGCLDSNTEIIAEIVNPLNYNSLKNVGIMSVIMSNKIISLFMSQILTHPGSRKFYRDVISTNSEDNNGSIDFEIIKAEDLLVFEEESLLFSSKAELVQSFYFSSNKTRMIIGFKKMNSKDIYFLCDDMDKEENIIINKDDELIVTRY